MKSSRKLLGFLLPAAMAVLQIVAAAETDGRLHADGKGWRLDQAKITDPKRPRVLLIGDSILNGYLKQTTAALEGKAYVDAWVNPYHQSEHLNKLLAEVLTHGPYDVVHFNMGLHGWPEGRIKPGTFEPLTRSYVEVLKTKLPKAKLIWASSTPVTAQDKPAELEPDINPVIVEHNRMAAKVMAEMGVPVSDFYALLVDKRGWARGDRFHWTAPAYDLLARTVVETVLRELARSNTSKPAKPPFNEKTIRQWTLAGPLGETPKRGSEILPLSDQQNLGGWVKLDTMSDEFAGPALDTNKWTVGMSWWRGRQPAWFSPSNVAVRAGQLHLTMRKEPVPPDMEKHGYKDYTSAALHTRARSAYGYYEVKSRAMNSGGSSSFWFQNEDNKAHPGWATEIDVFELCGKGAKFERGYHMNAHVFKTPQEQRHWSAGGNWTAPWRFADDFHVFGFEWTRDELRWYVDGVVVRTVQNTHWHQPLHLIFDSETMPEWFGMPDEADLPSTFSIEYVRAWTRTQPDAPQNPAKP
jgi:hypothetical protein